LAYDSATHRVFLFGDTTAVVDLAHGISIGHIVLHGKPEGAVADGRGRLYVNLEDEDSMAVLDAAELHVVARWPLAPCRLPLGLAIDRARRRLFVACRGELMVVDAETGRQVSHVSLVGVADQNAFDPGTGLIFMPNGGGSLTIIHEDTPDRYSVVQTVRDSTLIRIKVVVDEQTHRAFVPRGGDQDPFDLVVLAPDTDTQ
jgi:hypothetical protein